MSNAPLFTIGFTQKTAKVFFETLGSRGVRTLLDTRLNNSGQLAGFSKRDDLAYFTTKLVGGEYVHWLEAAPTDDLLRAFKKKEISWDLYAREDVALMEKRLMENTIPLEKLEYGCLLCSEAKPHNCHRRLLAEYLNTKLKSRFEIVHL